MEPSVYPCKSKLRLFSEQPATILNLHGRFFCKLTERLLEYPLLCCPSCELLRLVYAPFALTFKVALPESATGCKGSDKHYFS